MTRATPATIRVAQETVFTPTLFLACALGEHTWPLGGTTGAAPRPRERPVPAGDGPTVPEERRRAKSRIGWPEEARGGVATPPAGLAFGATVFRQPGRAAPRGRRGQPCGASPRPPGANGSLGWAQAAHEAAASCGWGKDGVACQAGAERGRGRPPPAAPGRLRTQRGGRAGALGATGRLAGPGLRLGLQGEVEPPCAAGARGWRPAAPAWRARRTRAGQQGQGRTAPSTPLEAARRAALRPREEPGRAQGGPLGPGGLGAPGVALCAGMFCLAGLPDAAARGGRSRAARRRPPRGARLRGNAGGRRPGMALGGPWPARWRGAGAACSPRAC